MTMQSNPQDTARTSRTRRAADARSSLYATDSRRTVKPVSQSGDTRVAPFIRRWLALLLSSILGFGLLVVATAAPSSAAAADSLAPGQTLHSGQQLVSANGSVRLVMQPDGNLVLYLGDASDPAHALWDSGTGRGA